MNENTTRLNSNRAKRILALVVAVSLVVSSLAVILERGRLPLYAAVHLAGDSNGNDAALPDDSYGDIGDEYVEDDVVEDEVDDGVEYHDDDDILDDVLDDNNEAVDLIGVAASGSYVNPVPFGTHISQYRVFVSRAEPNDHTDPNDWILYTPPQPPLELFPGMGVDIFMIYARPIFGYSMRGWHPMTNQLGYSTSNTRQLSSDLFYYFVRAFPTPDSIVAIFDKIEIDATHVEDLGVRIVGYNNPPLNSGVLSHASHDLNIVIPSVYNSPPFGAFPGPGPTPVPGPDFHAITQRNVNAQSDWFNLGTEDLFIRPIPITSGVSSYPVGPLDPLDPLQPRLNVSPQLGLQAGTHDDVVLIRHGTAVVGSFPITFRVERPVSQVVIDVPNRGAGGPSYDGEINVDITVYRADSTTPTMRVVDPITHADDIGYNYVGSPTTNLQRNGADITIEIPPPCDYTFFVDIANGITIDDFDIFYPVGYELHSYTVNGAGNLLVVLRPIPTLTVDITRSGDMTTVTVPVAEYPGFNQATNVLVGLTSPTTGQVPIIINNPPGGFHFNNNTTVNFPPGYVLAEKEIVDASGNLQVTLHPYREVHFDLNGGTVASDPCATVPSNTTATIVRTNRLQGNLIGPSGPNAPIPVPVIPDPLPSQFGVPADPTRANFEFAGWQEFNASGNIGPVLYPANHVWDLIVTGSTRSFRAVWRTPGGVVMVTSTPIPTQQPQPTSEPDDTPSRTTTATPTPTPTMTPTPTPKPPTTPTPDHHAFIIGFDDGTVRPHAHVTRSQFATILFRLMSDELRIQYWEQDNPYSDVSINMWHNNAVSTTTNIGFITGMPSGDFEPNRPITRAELTVGMMRFLGIAPIEYNGTRFNDINGHWARTYINTLAQYGWAVSFVGDDVNFLPNQPITRAETAAMVNRMLDRLPKCIDSILDGVLTFTDNVDPDAWYYLYIIEAANSHYYDRCDCCDYEIWISLIYPPRRWEDLERPDSRPDTFR